MVIDTSAVLAVLLAEPDGPDFAGAIATAERRLMSAASFLETAIVIDSQLGAAAGRQLDVFADRAGLTVVPVSLDHVRIARQAYADYGKGHHPAGLNFGDCFAYALAKAAGEPLLFKGTDFAATDITAAL